MFPNYLSLTLRGQPRRRCPYAHMSYRPPQMPGPPAVSVAGTNTKMLSQLGPQLILENRNQGHAHEAESICGGGGSGSGGGSGCKLQC